MYLLLFLSKEVAFLTPELIDKVVCAELLDPSWDPIGELADVVTSQMSHGPYSLDNLKVPCIARKTPTALFTY